MLSSTVMRVPVAATIDEPLPCHIVPSVSVKVAVMVAVSPIGTELKVVEPLPFVTVIVFVSLYPEVVVRVAISVPFSCVLSIALEPVLKASAMPIPSLPLTVVEAVSL